MIKASRQRTQSQRVIAATHYTLFAIVTLRALLSYGGTSRIELGLLLLAIFLLLYATEPWLSYRWRPYSWLYFGLETGLVVWLGLLAPRFDFLWSLYVILGTQAVFYFPIRAAVVWCGLLIIIAAPFLITAMGAAIGLSTLFNLIAVGIFVITFGRLSWQAEVARAESAALVEDLQTAHAKLQDYAVQAEDLSAVHERNRVARELHDSVNQSIFSITLTVEAARTMLDREPARVSPYLDQLEALTGNALAQLRSLITQLRPKE